MEGEDIVEKINTYVEDHHINLLSTAPRKLSFLVTLFHKSASKKSAVHTRVPILMLFP